MLIDLVHMIRQILDSNGVSISSKGKALVLSSDMEAYSKEALREEIRRLTVINIQLMSDKLGIEAVKTKLEADKARLINEKNIFVAKREELRAELTEAAVISTTNIQTPVIIVYDKFKAKRLPPFDGIKKTF